MRPRVIQQLIWMIGVLAVGGSVAGALMTSAASTPLLGNGAAGTLIVLNKGAASASLIDLATGREYARLPTEEGPHEVTVSQDGRWAVVTNYGSAEAPGHTLTVLDMRERRVARTIDLVPYHRPHGVAWLPDGRRVAVTAESESTVVVVDVPRAKIVGAVRTAQGGSHMVAVSPDGRRAYVANIASGSVTELDMERLVAVRTSRTGAGAEGIAVSPDGREVWVTNREVNTVSVLDASSLESVATLASADFPIRVKLTPDGRSALVSNARSGEVRVFDVARRQAVATIAVGADSTAARETILGDDFGASAVPIGILVVPDGKVAYVATAAADAVVIVDVARRKVVGRLKAGREPDGLGYSPIVPPVGGR